MPEEKISDGGESKVMKQEIREQTTIRLPAELKEQLQREADRRGISFNALVLTILNEERTHHQKE